MIEFAEAFPDDAGWIAKELGPHLRKEDAAECEAFGLTPEGAVLMSVQSSIFCMTAWEEGSCLAAWGFTVPNIVGDHAQPWLLTSVGVLRHRKVMLRANRIFLKETQQKYPILETIVHAEYKKAIRWLRWLGFTIHKPVRVGPKNELFHRVTLGDAT